ncbi:MAG TPA: dihydrolipoamide acetyltransferase family protein [Feifaniaceae bacterium]|nr:dihydrolipoamide acetyltransferase family protein [Feifaniaceae bacterium]
MAVAVNMPKLGLQMTSGVITQWLVAEGDAVKKGDPIFSIETDKIVSDVESTASGTVLKILVPAGGEAKIMEPCCYVGAPGEKLPDAAAEVNAAAEPVTQPPAAPAPELAPAAAEAPAGRLFATPYARKLAKDFGVDIHTVRGTGPNGRIQKRDVLSAQEDGRVRITPAAKKLAEQSGVDYAALSGSGPNGRVQKEDVLSAVRTPDAASDADCTIKPMSAMRKTVARRLTESKQNIPHVYYEDEVDATGLIAARELFQNAALKKNGSKLTYNDIILKAVAAALAEFADVNAQIRGEDVAYFRHVNLGFAVSIKNGLIVPVIKKAEEKSVAELSKEASQLTEKARSGRLVPEEFTGGTFTVSNLGGYGLENFHAVINPPESGILAVGAIRKKPVVVNDAIVVRPMMRIAASLDHRLVDGALAAQFLARVKQLLEDAAALFF